jgi:hypothetical protein
MSGSRSCPANLNNLSIRLRQTQEPASLEPYFYSTEPPNNILCDSLGVVAVEVEVATLQVNGLGRLVPVSSVWRSRI